MIELIYLIFNIMCGILGGLLSFNIPVNQMQEINLIENYSKVYTILIVVLIVYTYVFTYLKQFVRIILSTKKIVSEKMDMISSIAYSVIFIATLYCMNGFRELIVIDGSVLIAIIALLAIFAVGKTYRFHDCYALDCLLLHDNKVQRKNQQKMIFIGGIFGILASTILVIANIIFQKYNVFVAFVISVALFIAYDLIYQNINYKIYFKLDYKDKVLEDFGTYSFKLFSMIFYFVVFATIFKFPLLFSLLYAYILKFLHRLFLFTTDDGGSSSSSYSADNKNNKRKDLGFKTTSFYDNFGNYKGSATTYTVGDITTTDVKDETGKTVGTETSFDFGGVTHSTYKKN